MASHHFLCTRIFTRLAPLTVPELLAAQVAPAAVRAPQPGRHSRILGQIPGMFCLPFPGSGRGVPVRPAPPVQLGRPLAAELQPALRAVVPRPVSGLNFYIT